MSSILSQHLHTYDRHHVLEGSRWLRHEPRDNDVVVSTSYKAGTTWVQTIIANLIFQDGEFPAPICVMSPWFEMRIRPAAADFAHLESQSHRRSIKTHLPLSGLPCHPQVKYVVVGRDGRDVFMSMLNHPIPIFLLMKRCSRRSSNASPSPVCVRTSRALIRWQTSSGRTAATPS